MSPPPAARMSDPRADTATTSSYKAEPPPPGGLFHHLWGWAEAILRYVQLRSQLVITEAKEAGSHFGIIAALFLGALVVALLAYLLLMITVVFALAAWMDGPHAWLKIMGGAAGLHILLAVVLVLMAKSRLKAGVFTKTKAEFKKDKLWHKTPPSPAEPTN